MRFKQFRPEIRTIGLVVLSGLSLGLSQPMLLPKFVEDLLGGHGLLGLLSLIGYSPIIYLIMASPKANAFRLAFFASLIHFSITFYWIYIALTVFGEIHGVFSVAVLLVMAATISCYIGAAFFAAQFLNRRFKISYLLVIPASVCAAEYLRNYGIFGGFPWGNIGYGITQVSVFLQSVSLVGIYGLVFVIVLINSLLAQFGLYRFNIQKIPKMSLVSFIGILLGTIGFGSFKLSGGFEIGGKVLKVALLQGNIEQGIKNKSDIFYTEIISRYEQLQADAIAQGAELVVWPESAYPHTLANSLERIEAVKKGPKATVFGTVLYGEQKYYNAALVLDENSRVISRYYKSHLVPFGEYVPWPFRKVAAKVVPNMGAFVPGNEYVPTSVNMGDFEARLGMTICYEGVFPEISRTLVKNGANLLINMTNDAWYGVSSAPYQHLHMYRVRAVETGVSVVRATNTGVSAWIDSYGYVHQPTALYERELLIADVPVTQKITAYMTIGDIIAQFSLLFVVFAMVLGMVGRDVFSKKRSAAEWVLGAFGLALVIWAEWYFADAKRALDESAITKQIIVSVFGLIVLIAAWSGKNSARKVMITTGIVTAVLSSLVGIAEGSEYFFMTGVSAIVVGVAFMRAKAYR